jgi:hypothetical protein
MDWELFYGCLNTVIFSTDSWAIFHYDEDAPGKKGAVCEPHRDVCPAPGKYILLKPGIHLIFIIGYFTSLMYCRWWCNLCRFRCCCGSYSSSDDLQHTDKSMLFRMYHHNFFQTKVYRQKPIEDECALVTLVASYRVSKSSKRISLVSRLLIFSLAHIA